MPIRPKVQVVVPPKQAGGEWFTVELDATYVSRDEIQERRRLGLPLRTFLPSERIAAILNGPQFQTPPTHLPGDRLAVYNECVKLLNQAIAISRADEGPGSMYSGRVASQAWGVFTNDDIAVQQVRWIEADCYPLGIDPMAVLLESEAQLRDLIDNAIALRGQTAATAEMGIIESSIEAHG